MDLREKLNQIDNQTLYFNLVLTQLVLFLTGFILYFLFLRKTLPITILYHVQDLEKNVVIGILFAVGVIVVDVLCMKFLPKHYFDDGGVNERLFRDINPFQIALIALLVSFVEEWLFRGILQNLIGIVGASIIFAVIHYRYFKHWLYASIIILLSFGFGFLYEWSGSLWTVISAHFVIDFCLGLMIRYKYL